MSQFLILTLHDDDTGDTLECTTIGVGEAKNLGQAIEETKRLWTQSNKQDE